jgi:hypothetical protein
MDYIIYIVLGVVAFWLGWHARAIVFMANLSIDPERTIKMLEKIREINEANTEEELDSIVSTQLDAVEVEPEQVKGVWYAYAKPTGQFLGQGSSLEEALTQAANRFPDKKFWCKTNEQVSQTA